MAGDRESKTEDPSSKRLSDARKKGNIPRSQDVNASVIMLVAAVLIYNQWRAISEVLYLRMHNSFQSFPTGDFTVKIFMEMMGQSLGDVGKAVTPTVFTLMGIGVAVNILQTGFLLTGEPLKPNFGRMNPLSGFQRIFSLRGVVETVKGIVKIVLVGYLAYQVIKDRYLEIVTALQLDGARLAELLGGTAWEVSWRSIVALLVLGVADYAYQRFEWWRDLKMTKQEIKDEAKQQEGSPEVKAEIRKRQMQAARRRMMSEVPKAAVVITNPTHFAVALQYKQGETDVPTVVAKGTDLVAKRIRDIARESNVPLVENPPLARALHAQVEIGDAIPADFYAIVAEILVSVTRAEKKRAGKASRPA
jgi:flagellar biosynthetic protein FlhB